MRLLVSAVVLSLAVPTAAQAACTAVYPVGQLITDLGASEKGVRESNADMAGTAAMSLERGLPCLGDVLPNIVIPRTYRAIAGSYYLNNNLDKARVWFQTAIEADAQFEYGVDDLPAEHPMRIFYAESREGADVAPMAVEGMLLLGTGNHFLDGRRWTEAGATLDRPHLYQYQDEASGQVLTKLMFGNDFPPEVLVIDEESAGDITASGKPPKEPRPERPSKEGKPPKEGKPAKEKQAKAPKPAKQPQAGDVLKRTRPWEKTPLMLLGGATMGGAVATYVASNKPLGQFYASTQSNEDAAKYARATNQLVILSGVIGVAGASTFTWGAIIDAGGTPMPAVRIRF